MKIIKRTRIFLAIAAIFAGHVMVQPSATPRKPKTVQTKKSSIPSKNSKKPAVAQAGRKPVSRSAQPTPKKIVPAQPTMTQPGAQDLPVANLHTVRTKQEPLPKHHTVQASVDTQFQGQPDGSMVKTVTTTKIENNKVVTKTESWTWYDYAKVAAAVAGVAAVAALADYSYNYSKGMNYLGTQAQDGYNYGTQGLSGLRTKVTNLWNGTTPLAQTQPAKDVVESPNSEISDSRDQETQKEDRDNNATFFDAENNENHDNDQNSQTTQPKAAFAANEGELQELNNSPVMPDIMPDKEIITEEFIPLQSTQEPEINQEQAVMLPVNPEVQVDEPGVEQISALTTIDSFEPETVINNQNEITPELVIETQEPVLSTSSENSILTPEEQTIASQEPTDTISEQEEIPLTPSFNLDDHLNKLTHVAQGGVAPVDQAPEVAPQASIPQTENSTAEENEQDPGMILINNAKSLLGYNQSPAPQMINPGIEQTPTEQAQQNANHSSTEPETSNTVPTEQPDENTPKTTGWWEETKQGMAKTQDQELASQQETQTDQIEPIANHPKPGFWERVNKEKAQLYAQDAQKQAQRAGLKTQQDLNESATTQLNQPTEPASSGIMTRTWDYLASTRVGQGIGGAKDSLGTWLEQNNNSQAGLAAAKRREELYGSLPTERNNLTPEQKRDGSAPNEGLINNAARQEIYVF